MNPDFDFEGLVEFERTTEPVPHNCPVPTPDLVVYCHFCGEFRQDMGPGRGVVTWKGEPVTAEDLARVRGLPPDPHRNSPAWWQQATKADLEPGWAGLPDVPLPAAPEGACSGCGMTVPPPGPSGTCRYCRADHPGNALLSRPHVMTPRQRMELWQAGYPGALVHEDCGPECPLGVARRRARSPVVAVARLVLLALQLVGAMTVVVWGAELLGWLIRLVSG
jgi:hypothetical protein